MKYLGVEEITTPKQQNNGTREFALPYKVRGKRVTLASYKSGYVRIDRNCHSRYQINPTYKVPYKFVSAYGELKSWTNKRRMMKKEEKNRIDFIFNYILKNYYNKQWQK